MIKLTKKDFEKSLNEAINDIGLANYCSMDGEGHIRNSTFYCFILNNGEQRYLTNPSAEFLKTIGLESDGIKTPPILINCDTCCWGYKDDLGDCYCVNGGSDLCTDYVTDKNTCELWESKYG